VEASSDISAGGGRRKRPTFEVPYVNVWRFLCGRLGDITAAMEKGFSTGSRDWSFFA